MAAGHAEWGIVRILASRPGKPTPSGAGFLISDRHALTCAHVVNESLGRGAYAPERPDAPVFLDLPATAGSGLAGNDAPVTTAQTMLSAHIVVWCPAREKPRHGQPDDIAVLLLDEPCNAEHALPLLRPDSTVDAGYRGYAYGFPERGDNGIWAKGELSGHQHFGWRQIADLGGTAIDMGFSGCPFLDAAQERVIGMVVARHNRFPVSYLIPVATLLQAWDQLAHVARLVDLPEPIPRKTAMEAAANTKTDQQQNVGVRLRTKVETGGGADIGGNLSTGGGDAAGRDQTKIAIDTINIFPPPGAPASPAPSPPETPATVDAGLPILTLQVDCTDGVLSSNALRPKHTSAHKTRLEDLQRALARKDHDALFRTLFESPFQLADLVSAAGGSPHVDDPTAKPLRLRLVCTNPDSATLPWHCISRDGRRLGEAGWIVELVSAPDGGTRTIALDNPLVVAPSDPTLPIGARSHATNVTASLRRLLADCRAMVPWVSSYRELDIALDKEPDLLYLFAQIDGRGDIILGKDAAHREAYPLDRLSERLEQFHSRPLVWLHLVAGGEAAANLAALWKRLRPLTHLLLIQLTTPGKVYTSPNSTLECMAAMAEGTEEPAAVLSRLGSHRDTHVWLGADSLRLSPCSDSDAALFDYIRASLIRLLLGRKPEKRQLRSGISEKPEGFLTLCGVCGDVQACVHDLPEQARRYIEELDRHTVVETRPLPLTMRASPTLRDEVAAQLVQDLNISPIMSAQDALRHIPVVPPDREDTLIVALSWLLEPAADFTPDLLADWLAAWKLGVLDVLDKEQIPPDFRLLVSACIQWPDRWPERHGSDALALQQDIDRVLDRANPRDYVHCIEMQRPLSLLRAADLGAFYGDRALRQRLHAQDLPIDRLVNYILDKARRRFQDTVELIYTECKHRYADFRDTLKDQDA